MIPDVILPYESGIPLRTVRYPTFPYPRIIVASYKDLGVTDTVSLPRGIPDSGTRGEWVPPAMTGDGAWEGTRVYPSLGTLYTPR